MSEILYNAWAEGALSWIADDSTGLPWPLPTTWCLGEATEDTRFLAIHLIRATPDDLAPLSIGITAEGSILIEWRKGSRELNIRVLPDVTLDISTWESAELVEESSIERAAIWRLCRFFAWLRSTQ